MIRRLRAELRGERHCSGQCRWCEPDRWGLGDIAFAAYAVAFEAFRWLFRHPVMCAAALAVVVASMTMF